MSEEKQRQHHQGDYNFTEETQGRLSKAVSGYEQAIQYYTLLKQTFLQDIYNTQNIISDQMANNFINKLNIDLQQAQNNGSLINEQDVKIKELYILIENKVKAYLDGSGNNLKEEQEQIRKIHSRLRTTDKNEDSELKRYTRLARQDLDNFLAMNSNLDEEIQEILAATFGITQANITGVKALYRRILLNQINNGKYTSQLEKSLSGYKNLFRGYYSEKLKAEVSDQVLSRLPGNYGAKQAGDSPIEGSLGEYDIVFARRNKIGTQSGLESVLQQLKEIDNNFNFEVSASVGTEGLDDIRKPAYGAQSKLWLLPEELDQSRPVLQQQWYSIGGRSSLSSYAAINVGGQNDFSWNRGWHQGVLLLSKELIKVFGSAQVLFGTRNAFIWTYQLIQKMREANLWVSFYFTRNGENFNYPGTSEVVWDMPRYQYINERRKASAIKRARINKK